MQTFKQVLQWLQQYNKAFTAVLGVPLFTYLAANLLDVLQQYGIITQLTPEQVASAVIWIVTLAVGAGVVAVPNVKAKE